MSFRYILRFIDRFELVNFIIWMMNKQSNIQSKILQFKIICLCRLISRLVEIEDKVHKKKTHAKTHSLLLVRKWAKKVLILNIPLIWRYVSVISNWNVRHMQHRHQQQQEKTELILIIIIIIINSWNYQTKYWNQNQIQDNWKFITLRYLNPCKKRKSEFSPPATEKIGNPFLCAQGNWCFFFIYSKRRWHRQRAIRRAQYKW